MAVEYARGNAPRFWHPFRIFAQGHVRQVQQPARSQIAWAFAQVYGVVLNGAAGSFLQGVDAVAADRQQAGIRGVVLQAVLLLSEAQIGDGELVVQHVDEALGRRHLPGLYGHQNALHLFDTRAQIPGSHPLLGNPQAHVQPLDRAHRLPQ